MRSGRRQTGGDSGNSRSDCSNTTIPKVNNSRPLAMSLACAVRGLGVVEVSIVTHRLQAARIGRKLSHVKSNAKGKKAIIIQRTLGVEKLTE